STARRKGTTRPSPYRELFLFRSPFCQPLPGRLAHWSRLTFSDVASAVRSVDPVPLTAEPLPDLVWPIESDGPPAHALRPAWPNATENSTRRQNNDVNAPRRPLRVRPCFDRIPISPNPQ